MIERGSPKSGLYLFWWVQLFGLYFWDSMLFLGPSFGHWMCYFVYYFANPMAHFKGKKGELGTFRLGQVYWGQQLLLVIFIQFYAPL